MRLTKEEKQIVAQRYKRGWTMQRLADCFKTTRTSICRILKKIGVKARPAARGVYFCNFKAFDVVMEVSAYWAGFLMADGNIGLGRRGGGQQSINLCLAAADYNHIVKFKAFMESESPILKSKAHLKTTGKDYVNFKISIHSDYLANALAKFGVVPQKTKKAFVLLLENNRDFWRGYIDGNGSIIFPSRPKSTPILGCCAGSKILMDQLSTYIARIDSNDPPPVRLGHGSWDLRIHGARAAFFARHLYQHSEIYLNRKFEKAKLLMKYKTKSVQYFKPPKRQRVWLNPPE